MSVDLLEVQVLPCSFIKDVLIGSIRVLKEGVEKKEGMIILGFKVVGENRIITVLSGGTDSGVKHLNAAYGSLVGITSTPMRRFESFASNVLGCETKKLAGRSVKDLQNSTGELFWLKFSFDYEGMNVGQFMNCWKEECDFWLNLKLQNDIQVELFKVVGRKEIHMFVRAPNADLLDDLLFTSPIVKTLGSQVKVEAKSVIFLGDYFQRSKSNQ